MRATAVVFPFDLFGNAGTSAGACLLGDVLNEVIADIELETRATRQDAFRGKLRVEECPFDTLEQLNHWRETGREAVREYLDHGEFVLWLSGNHLGVLPVYEELGPRSLVVQLDAHLDCYDLHDTIADLSHGNWLLHAATPLPKVVNIGHRDLFLPAKAVKRTFVDAIPAAEFDRGAKAVCRLAAKAERVWIDIDVDVFDPAFCPAVHEPLPFGPTPGQVLGLLDGLWSEKVAGVSISEFDPGRDVRDTSLNLLGWLLEWVLLKQYGAA
jgi:arginase family enzyme